MLYLRELMKDYKNELKGRELICCPLKCKKFQDNVHFMTCSDILAADRQTASEIEFDLRRFEEEEAAQKRPPKTPHVLPRTPQFAAAVGGTRTPATAQVLIMLNSFTSK